MSLIELTNLEVTIGHKTILKSIDLTIEEGTVTAFVGPSGSGKTTLLRTLNLLQIPTSGRLRVGDTEVIGGKINKRDIRQIRQIRNHSTMVFQQFHLFKNYTVLQNVVQPLVLSGRFSRKEAEIIAHESLEKVGLAAFENQYPVTLSGGQQQRVAIARVLTQNPKIILADEPTASLDPQTSRRVMHDLKMLNEEYGMTVVANLHSVELAKEFGDRVIGVRAGQIVYDGKMSETSQAVFDDIYNGGNGKKGEEDA